MGSLFAAKEGMEGISEGVPKRLPTESEGGKKQHTSQGGVCFLSMFKFAIEEHFESDQPLITVKGSTRKIWKKWGGDLT